MSECSYRTMLSDTLEPGASLDDFKAHNGNGYLIFNKQKNLNRTKGKKADDLQL